MSGELPTELRLLLRQQERLLVETHGIRDDMAVLIAMVQRLDGNVAGLVNEVRASHSRYARLEQRVRTLEGRVPQEQG